MSQKPTASRPASRSSADGQRVILPPVKTRDDLHHTGQQVEWQSGQRPGSFRSRHSTLPSPQLGARAPSQTVTTTRDLGVSSILNPAEPDSAGSGSSGPRPSAGSPRSSVQSSFGQGSQLGANPSSADPTQAFSGNHQDSFTRRRRILTPRSPRTVSSGMGPITGTRDAQQSPFIRSRSQIVATDSGPAAATEYASIPTPPIQQQNQQQYGFPPVSTPLERRQNTAYSSIAQPTQPGHSQSVSPSMSASSHIPSTQASPATYYPSSGLPPPSQNYFPGSSLQQAGGMQFGGGTEGASARFRQRRKEKEREASSNIDRLQQAQRELERRVREVEQERDFYRNERDRFRDVVFRTPGLRDMALQGPPSPRAIRTGSSNFPPPPGQQSGSSSATQAHPPNYESGQERAPRRQRTTAQGDFAPAPLQLAPATTLPPVQSAGFMGQPILPPLRIDNPTAASSASNMPSASTAAPQPPYDPYARPPLFDRRWSGDSSGRR